MWFCDDEYSEEEKYKYGKEEDKFVEFIRSRILHLREHKPNSPEIERLMKIAARFVCPGL